MKVWRHLPNFLRPNRRRVIRDNETGSCALDASHQVPYKIIRSSRRKRTLSLSIESGPIIKVAAPLRTSRRVIEGFIGNHARWIARRLSETKIVMTPQFVDGARIAYLGYSYQLRVMAAADGRTACRLAPRVLTVMVDGDALLAAHAQDEVRLEIMLWLKKRAQVKLQKRLDLWAQRLGLHYRQMMLSNPRRRWGSCSAGNVIRLNWRLIMAPLPLIDYVVAHELCHVVHKNHGPEFWRLLASVMPDYKIRRRQLRKIEGGMVL